MNRRSARDRRHAYGAFLALVALAAAVIGAPALAGAAVAADGADGPAFTTKKTIVRDRVDPVGGGLVVQDSREVTITVDQTDDLQGMQGVRVSWAGARPAANVYGNISSSIAFDGQEYPVVILQCRGTEPTPDMCWTTDPNTRQMITDPQDFEGKGLWKYDRHWREGELDALTGTPPADYVVLPFVDAAGKSWPMTSDAEAPPEAVGGQAARNQEAAVPTSPDGTGTFLFTVHSAAQNASLGCSDKVPCSLVVIPIMGTSCASDGLLPKLNPCTAEGKLTPGSTYTDQAKVSPVVTGRSWWTPSSWANRVVVPLTFAPGANACNLLDSSRRTIPFYGSALVGQATLQWAPAYCSKADRFTFQGNAMVEAVAFRNLAAGEIPAAFLTYPGPVRNADPPVGYAPVAVTGFAVAFVWDRPGNSGQLLHLKLTPRLLAKLITGSYAATVGRVDQDGGLTASGKVWPDVARNPISLNSDPEFLALNPGLVDPQYPWTDDPNISLASIISLSNPGDVIRALTAYIAADPEAAAFIAGEPDPWGMTVNGAYKGIALPRDSWPLQDVRQEPARTDTTLPDGSTRNCDKETPISFYNRVLAPVSSLVTAADDVLAAWPTYIERPELDQLSGLCSFKRAGQQTYGSRTLLGLVTLADARRYGLPTASLRSSGTGDSATFVDADEASMAAAVASAKRTEVGQPYLVDAAALHDVAGAYPGTMTVSVAAALTGLEPETAGHVAQFVRVATTEGQVRGSGVGELPDGYLPITATGATAPLYAAAQEVANAIEAQAGAIKSATVTTPPSTQTSAGAPLGGSQAPASATLPDASGQVTVDGLPAADPPSAAVAGARGNTPGEKSSAATVAVPAVLAAGVVGLAGAPLVRGFSTRRRRA